MAGGNDAAVAPLFLHSSAGARYAWSSMAEPHKPVTDVKIAGTQVPDVRRESAAEPDKRWMSMVAVGTAILAALAAISSMYSGNHLNAAMLEQIEASDQWNFYQAKGIKHAVLEGRLEMLPALGKGVDEADKQRLDRYKSEQEKIRGDAAGHQNAAVDHRRRHGWMGRAATAFQIAIALSAVTLLTRRNAFWIVSMVAAAAGVYFFSQGFFPLA